MSEQMQEQEQRELLQQLLARYADAFARGVRQRIARDR